MIWEKRSAQVELRSALRFFDESGGKNKTSRNNLIAQNILHGDLGYFHDENSASYNLDDETRDRLIAHARQDAALAVLNTASVLEDMKRLRNGQRAVILLLLVIMGLIIWNAT